MSDLIKGDLYIGTKLIVADTMTKQEYCDFRGWKVPENEDPAESGMLVEYEGTDNQNVEGRKGYVSWSPMKVFIEAYKASGEFSLGSAIELMKRDFRVARTGWNGKGMYLFIIQGSNDIAKLHGYGFGEYENEPTFSNAIFMLTTDNKLIPWLASQADMLAEDWVIVE